MLQLSRYFIAVIVGAVMLFACKTPQLAGEKEIITIRDTIIRFDTIINIKADSIFFATPCRDTTIYIEKEKIQIKTIIKNGIVEVQAKCKEQNYRITKDVALRLINRYKESTYIKEKKYIPFLVWVLFGLIALPAGYGTFKIVTKFI